MPYKKGNIPWIKGKHHSKETREKISESHTGVKRPNFKGNIPWNKGKTNCYTKEAREKMSQSHVKYMIDNSKFPKQTSIEKKIEKQLEDSNLDFVYQYAVNKKYICDFFIPAFHLIIEADGDYWHSRSGRMQMDAYKDMYLSKHGFDVLRIPECIINKEDFQILDFIG